MERNSRPTATGPYDMSPLAPEYSLLALVAAFLAGLVVGRLTGAAAGHRRSERKSRHAAPMATAAEAVALLPEETRLEIEMLLADGRKIEAVRLCRAALGLDLAEAKDAISLIERGKAPGARAP